MIIKDKNLQNSNFLTILFFILGLFFLNASSWLIICLFQGINKYDIFSLFFIIINSIFFLLGSFLLFYLAISSMFGSTNIKNENEVFIYEYYILNKIIRKEIYYNIENVSFTKIDNLDFNGFNFSIFTLDKEISNPLILIGEHYKLLSNILVKSIIFLINEKVIVLKKSKVKKYFFSKLYSKNEIRYCLDLFDRDIDITNYSELEKKIILSISNRSDIIVKINPIANDIYYIIEFLINLSSKSIYLNVFNLIKSDPLFETYFVNNSDETYFLSDEKKRDFYIKKEKADKFIESFSINNSIVYEIIENEIFKTIERIRKS